MQRQKILPRSLMLGILVIIIATLAYIYIYQQQPFPAPWSDYYTSIATVLPAFLAAWIATLVFRQFRRDDPPRRVWLFFTLGWWGWAIAELVWFFYYIGELDVPVPSLSDLFWLLAYFPFGMAFLLQYRLIYRTSRKQEAWTSGLSLAGIFLGSLVATWFLHQTAAQAQTAFGVTYLNVLYVFGDLAMLVAAVKLATGFGRGLWGRAWWGLLVLTVSDALYSWAELSGQYAMSVESGSLLTLIVDLLYADAYWLVALAMLLQYLLLLHGPSLTARPIMEQAPEETG